MKDHKEIFAIPEGGEDSFLVGEVRYMKLYGARRGYYFTVRYETRKKEYLEGLAVPITARSFMLTERKTVQIIPAARFNQRIFDGLTVPEAVQEECKAAVRALRAVAA